MSTELTTLEQMVRAVERVRERLLRAAGALEGAGVPYAECGPNAVNVWIETVDVSATRGSPDAWVLVRRDDLSAVREALERTGFVYRSDVESFVDGPDGNLRSAVRLFFVGERHDPDDPFPHPTLDEIEHGVAFRVLPLEPLVQLLLARFRTLDCVLLRDLIDVGLVDESWVDRLPAPLDERLRALLDDPDG